MVSGTWDFKWPRGTQIRVAFQQLSPSDAERLEHDFRWLIERFISIAQRWLRGDANIGFDYNVDRFLPAPPESDLKSVLLPEH
ncbi:MAG TPA: hypothetical protein VJR89_27680, partial [Polyangiales bacterium]|nr:hypothetical protein [Polyangiales bacterium]